jgi:hypothetical protein
VYDETRSPATFRQKVRELAEKIRQDYPLIEGPIIALEKKRLVAGVGAQHRARADMKMIVYEEGAPIVHAQTGAVLDRSIGLLGEGSLVEVRPQVSFLTIRSKELGQIERQMAQGKSLKVITK